MRFFFICLLFVSCSQTIQPTKIQGIAMTMPYQVTLPIEISQEEREKIQSRIDQVFDEINQIYNRFNPYSELSKCNLNDTHILSEKLCCFFDNMDQIYDFSEKTFDPTVYTHYIAPEISWGWNLLKKEGNKLTTGNIQIDLSGIVKGYAIDLISQELEHLHYKNYLIDWAGDLLAKGSGYKKTGWTIELLPTKNTLQLSDMAIATSSALMPRNVQERNTSHIVNTQKQKVIEMKTHPIIAVSVVAPTCMLADALATAAASFEDLHEAKKWANRISKKKPGLAFYFVSENDAN